MRTSSESITRAERNDFEREAPRPTPLGEVIESSTTHFVAQCPPARLHTPPDFGAFVKVLPPGQRECGPETRTASEIAPEDPFADPRPPARFDLAPGTPEGTLYALVFSATTASAEPGRRPAAYGLDETRLREEQPQIFDLLATEFAALPLGFAQEGRLRPFLPPRPPRLHAFVCECSEVEICALTDAPDLLRRLIAAPGPTDPDELIAACLRHAYHCRSQDFQFLVRAGKQLAALLRDDPERLAALLRKLEP